MASGKDSVLILGASGFLGAHLVRVAEARGAGVICAVSRRPELRPWRAGPDEAGATGATRDVAIDLLEAGGPADALAQTDGPVILAAALSRAADCAREPTAAHAANVDLPGSVAALCARARRRLIHVSTDLVFGGMPSRDGGYTEDDSPSPSTVYGETKAAGERAVLSAYPGALVVRLPLLFGDSGGRALGAGDQILSALARGERPFLFTDEFRTPLDVGDAAAALLELAAGDRSGVLHVAGPDRLSRAELGRLILTGAGIAHDRVDSGRREERGAGARAADASLDASRARGLLQTPLRAPVEALAPSD